MPFIYGMIVPTVFLDATMEVYHRVAFPLYGIPRVKRSKYIKLDRQKLSYLKPLEKVNCVYCGYVNGLFAYAVQIAGETEKYWCGIKHEQDENFVPPAHHKDFLEYGDEKGYREIKTEELKE
jgi:hypothetical protein